jgi:hypothetical protein
MDEEGLKRGLREGGGGGGDEFNGRRRESPYYFCILENKMARIIKGKEAFSDLYDLYMFSYVYILLFVGSSPWC